MVAPLPARTAALPMERALLALAVTAVEKIATAPARVDALLAVVAEVGAHLAGADGAAVSIVEGDNFVVAAHAGHLGPAGPHMRARADTLAQLAFELGTPLDCANTSSARGTEALTYPGAGIGTVVVIPIADYGGHEAVLEVVAGRHYGFDPHALAVLRLVGATAAARLAHSVYRRT